MTSQADLFYLTDRFEKDLGVATINMLFIVHMQVFPIVLVPLQIL